MRINILLVLFVVLVAACGGGGDEPGSSPQINKEYLSVTPNLELLADGQTTEIGIQANCSWTITKDAEWLIVSPMSGSGNQTVTLSAQKNTLYENRTAVLYVKSSSLTRTITVTQIKATKIPNQLSVNKSELNYERDGGSQSFIISSNTSWSITAPDWCSLSVSSGSGNATVTVAVSKNEKAEVRSGQIIVTAEEVEPIYISVTQQPGEEIPHEPGSDDNLPPS